MIEFVSLFLGLVVGVQPVALSVGPGVASVEVRLDARSCGSIAEAPWQVACDFGSRLAPHRLEAIARDVDGFEVGRTEQWVNLARARSEASLSLEGETAGAPERARLIWESLDFDRPRRVQVSFDGTDLEFDGPKIELPQYEPNELHILSAEVEFSDTVSVRANAVFGGDLEDRISIELTAVVVENHKRRRPGVHELQGILLADGEPLRVVAVERPPLDLIVIREQSAGLFGALRRLVQVGGSQRVPVRTMLPDVLGPADRVRFAFPTAALSQGQTNMFELVPISGDVTRGDERTFFQILTGLSFAAYQENLPAQRVADAVAIAGVVASEGHRRRMVLLLTADEATDISRLSAPRTRDYLNSLSVPLTVWRLRPPGAEPNAKPSQWGVQNDLSQWGQFSAAYRELREALHRQVIVWVEGRHLPQTITLAANVENISLARRPSKELTEQLALLDAKKEPADGSDALEIETLTGVDSARTLPATPWPSRQERRRAVLTDERRIEQVHKFLREPVFAGHLGPFNLVTDLSPQRAPRLMKGLERIANQIPPLYSRHHGLPADLAIGATIAVFSDESSYRSLEVATAVETTELAGHATPGMVALFVGSQAIRAVESTFMHELVHLLNMSVLGPDIPPWLDEGLAGEMTLASLRSGRYVLEPLDPRRATTIRRRPEGPLSLVGELADVADQGRLPQLAELAALDRRGLADSPNSRQLYALSALWVHFLARIEPAAREGFATLLAETAANPRVAAHGVAKRFGYDEPELERRFRDWLRKLALATTP